jgi:glycerophosphoryl diester phosphodiesterase
MLTHGSRPLILGHRGARHDALENTLASFSIALEQGADGVELDVRGARDSVPMVIHDETLDRTFEIKGRIAALESGALQRLTSARLPTLEQTVAWAASSGAWLNIELKVSGVEEEVARLVRSTGISGRVIISSFDAETLRRSREVARGLPRFLLTDRWDAITDVASEQAEALGICLRVDAATPATIQELRRRSLQVIVWTVNDALRMRQLLAEDVTGIITDHPGMAARERAALFPT